MYALTRRLPEASGAVGILVLGVALVLPGPPPTTGQPARQLLGALEAHPGAFAVSAYLAGLSVLALCVFAGALHRFLSTDTPSSAPLGAALALVAVPVLIVVGMSTTTALALDAGHLDAAARPGLARAGVDAGNAMIEYAKFALAAVLLLCATATGRLGVLMRRTAVGSALVLLASAVTPFGATGGVGQFGGPIDLAGSVPAMAWVLALSVVMTTRAPAAALAVAVTSRA